MTSLCHRSPRVGWWWQAVSSGARSASDRLYLWWLCPGQSIRRSPTDFQALSWGPKINNLGTSAPTDFICWSQVVRWEQGLSGIRRLFFGGLLRVGGARSLRSGSRSNDGTCPNEDFHAGQGSSPPRSHCRLSGRAAQHNRLDPQLLRNAAQAAVQSCHESRCGGLGTDQAQDGASA
jgi:hypothetical protein